MIRAVVTDLDRTLLRTDKTISDRTVRALERCREQNIVTAYATARSQQSSKAFLERFTPDIFICHGGALVLRGEKSIGRIAMPEIVSSRLISHCLNTPEVKAVYIIDENIALTSDPHDSDPDRSHYRYAELSELRDTSYIKLSIRCGIPAVAKQIAAEFPACAMQAYSGEDLYTFASADASKWNAVKILSAHCGIPTGEIAAFGDDWNDVEMLQNCGYGVAMENAIPQVKAAARYSTCSNDSDGAAKWIEAHILRK